MSWLPGTDSGALDDPQSVEMVIIPRTGDIGNFEVKRALPFRRKRMVGPFIFWDQMGPGEFLTGQGIDVRPHPHIGLSTVTYLFNGTMDHKDSLGNDMRIVPGDVNLMTAGSGIVHSERTGHDIRETPSNLYGIQSWIAQPKSHEAGAPAFEHTDVKKLPRFDADGIQGRVILGEFDGIKSPASTQWETLYVDLNLSGGARLPISATTEERAIYVLKGQIEIAGVVYDPEQMMVLRPGDKITVKALDDVRMMLLGGAAMDGPRYIWWNFVSSSKDQLEQAKEDWRKGRFAKVPGDEKEFIPLPE
ncbi:pirin family protein [Kiloniella laminariae]|uniref:Pirin family protein n=1 Tax=Kiloniella laminariae TaxID=454162 RepID=A0ABT4LG47_9PROT|nr:pirin family protein [Kiloniella laminariae]MCZ4280076.1 pirin family protein [Kiloniella laminariae]